jgi:methylated-DNA-[protein]-cysteine S-methyltransferase
MRDEPVTKCTVFPTSIGWTAVLWRNGTITGVKAGYPDRGSLVKALPVKPVTVDANMDQAIERIRQFAAGKKTALSSLEIDESWMTPFQRSVVHTCRTIGWGETLTYGQLATLAGSPGASRAVGTVMARNRFPLIVPCHRVVAASGIGGFSAPCGAGLKAKLLANECDAIREGKVSPRYTALKRKVPQQRKQRYARMS